VVTDSSMQTFVVRVWTASTTSPENAQPGRLRGVVQHVATGRSETFTDDGELLEYLRELPAPDEDRAGTAGRR
jgi:hypothetical protein